VRQAEPRAALLRALDGIDRLVLLGDVIELRNGPVRDALGAAEQALGEIGAAVGEGREVVIVPGNHDHHLVEPWLERRARTAPPPPLGLESAVDWRADEVLDTVVRRLRPASIRVAYPGVWLRDDVYALHGHYCDRHTTVPMFERLAAGAMARIVRQSRDGPCRAEDYEAVLGPVYAWIHAVAQSGGPDLGKSSHGVSTQAWRALSGRQDRQTIRRRAMIAGFPAVVAALNRARLGPLQADLSGQQLRRAALRATGEALARLGIRARHVVFGHTHRAGPLALDEQSEWSAPTGSRMLNTGSWVHEPHFLGPDPPRSPYRPGFAVLVSDAGVPELRNLLEPGAAAPGEPVTQPRPA
jgi:hypothetical protein